MAIKGTDIPIGQFLEVLIRNPNRIQFLSNGIQGMQIGKKVSTLTRNMNDSFPFLPVELMEFGKIKKSRILGSYYHLFIQKPQMLSFLKVLPELY